jgi:hypothetical protein
MKNDTRDQAIQPRNARTCGESPGDNVAAYTRQGLFWVQRAGICVIAFVLPGFNGRPYALSSGFPCVLIAVFLLSHRAFLLSQRAFHRDLTMLRWRDAGALVFVLFAWVVVAVLSTIANANPDTAYNLVWSYLAPFVLFLSIYGLQPSSADYESIFSSFALGLLLRFSIGAWTFYQTWGIPSFSDLSLARFDLFRIDSYMKVTFGNTSSTASVLAVTIPVLVTSMMMPRRRLGWLVSIPALGVCIANVFITGSRATIIIVSLVTTLIAIKIRSRARFAIFGVLAIAAMLFIRNIGDENLARFKAVIDMDEQGDQSVAERLDSMRYGLETMRDHPWGTGPGMSFLDNPYTVPHQFAVAQGSDLGVLGMVCVILLSVIVLVKVIPFDLSRGRQLTGAIAFEFGAFTWIVFAMTANIGLSSGPTMTWSGLLAMFLALGTSRHRHRAAGGAPVTSATSRTGLSPRGSAGALLDRIKKRPRPR